MNNIEEKLLLIKYDKETNWFNVYQPNGEIIFGVMDVTMIQDQFEEGREKRITANFKAVCRFVNDDELKEIQGNNGQYLNVR